jgi:hypothetical protein
VVGGSSAINFGISTYGDQTTMDAALEQWKVARKGGFSKFACQLTIGFFKSDRIMTSNEFTLLAEQEQVYMKRETVPHYEVITHFPAHWFVPDFPKEHLNYLSLSTFAYNAQVRGEITLQSSDPRVPLKFDPKLLLHPFDQRVAIEALRSILQIVDHPAFAKDTVAVISAPKSSSDEDILDYWRKSLKSS